LATSEANDPLVRLYNIAHRDLRLFVCNAGRQVDVNGVLKEPFAQRFREAMRNIGYQALLVTAYLGDVKTSYLPRTVPESDTSTPRHQEMGEGRLSRSPSRGSWTTTANGCASTKKVTFA
jgi:hypothetical protein